MLRTVECLERGRDLSASIQSDRERENTSVLPSFPLPLFLLAFPPSPPENLINLRQHTRAHTDMHVPHANKPYIPEGQSLHLN